MLTTVSVHTNSIEAHIVRGRLEAESIPAHVAFQHHIWMDWSKSLALGLVRVQVPPSYEHQSLAVLADIRSGTYSAIIEAEHEGPFTLCCPDCGSFQTQVSKWSGKLALFMFFAFVLPVPYTNHSWRCAACGRKWVDRASRPYPLLAYVAGGGAVVAVLFAVHASLDYMCSVRFWVQTCY